MKRLPSEPVCGAPDAGSKKVRVVEGKVAVAAEEAKARFETPAAAPAAEEEFDMKRFIALRTFVARATMNWTHRDSLLKLIFQ